jgi:hypothetical protein
MVSDKLGRWVHFYLHSTSSAHHFLLALCWSAYQFLKWAFSGGIRFGLVISGFGNQHFLEFDQESLESQR